MDHHCPWVNNCIGENNQKYFVLFTVSVCLFVCLQQHFCYVWIFTCVIKLKQVPRGVMVYTVFLPFFTKVNNFSGFLLCSEAL